jgi:hypothetical protein
MTAAVVAAYLLPYAVVLLARGRSAKPADLAVDIPAAFAADLLLVLVLALAMRLDWAVLAARALWVAGGVWIARDKGAAWPAGIGLRAVAWTATAAWSGAWVSLWLSRDFGIWDRRWHMPLVTSLEGQSIPFHNVYDPQAVLHYHFSGDVQAAMVRALSFGHMSAALGLSLAHDIDFALLGAVVALLLVGRARHGWLVVFGVCAVLLHGPVVQTDGTGWMFRAHMYQTFLTDSFRPHIAIAGLLVTGMTAALCTRATERTPTPGRLAGALLPCAALLSVTDETSFVIVLASIGAAWLVDGKVLAGRWWQGLALLAGMAASGLAANLVFRASLAPGSPVQHLDIVPARMIDLSNGPHALWETGALHQLGYDLLPLVVPTAGAVLYAATHPLRRLGALVAAPCVATALSAVLATKVRVNGIDGVECQRFFVAVFFVVLVVALWLLPSMPRWSAAAGLVGIGAAVPVFFTVFWFRERSPEMLRGSESPPDATLGETLYEIDCPRIAAARIGQRPEVTYVDEKLWYLYTSCRGVFEAGLSEPPWPTKIKPAFEVPTHLAELSKLVPSDATVPAACSRVDARNDRVCSELRRTESCAPSGELFVTCPLGPEVRARLARGN